MSAIKKHPKMVTMDEAVLRMTTLLTEENAALEAMDFGRAGSLLAAKHAAADALATAWRAADPVSITPDTMCILGNLAEENRQLLKRAMRVQRRVLDLVAKAARLPEQPTRYGASGVLETANGNAQALKTRA